MTELVEFGMLTNLALFQYSRTFFEKFVKVKIAPNCLQAVKTFYSMLDLYDFLKDVLEYRNSSRFVSGRNKTFPYSKVSYILFNYLLYNIQNK